MTPTGDDPLLDNALLNKADALIRRNRPDGVGSDADELPLLTETILDDLPELTETIEETHALPTASRGSVSAAPSLDIHDHMPMGQFKPLSAMPPQELIDRAVAEAVAQAVAETRQSMRAEQERVLHEACARARTEALAEARVMQQHAVQAALAQGREEAEINQWPALQEARREAVQSAAAAMSERLIELDGQIAQSLNQWLAKELPPLIANELLGLSERLRMQTTAHVRATLLPELSEQISLVLESALREDSSAEH
jgi:hypothetical protein